MQGLGNTIDNNVLAAFGNKAPKGVMNAIKQASSKTGVDFAYLVQQAHAESSFDPDAKARTSSATGLYQFIESTWMRMVDKYGDKYGIDTQGKSRRDILELRKDPEIASNLAAEFAGENERFLNAHWGGEVGSTELYLAHFLGASGASAFLNAKDKNPLQSAAVIFPAAAKANQNVFYDRATGRARSFDEVSSRNTSSPLLPTKVQTRFRVNPYSPTVFRIQALIIWPRHKRHNVISLPAASSATGISNWTAFTASPWARTPVRPTARSRAIIHWSERRSRSCFWQRWIRHCRTRTIRIKSNLPVVSFIKIT